MSNSSSALTETPAASNVMALDRHSPLPLYVQIKRRVLMMILNWQQQSDRFHTDHELSEQFDVSRMTVRQAIQELVDEGYLRRVRGSGTFVCAPKIDEQFSPAMDFIDQWSANGRPLNLRVLRCAQEPASAAVARQLDVAPGVPVWSILRLRTVKQVPISIDYRYVRVDRIAQIDPGQVEAGSLLELIGQQVELAYGNLQIEGGAVQAEHADYLSLLPGDPVLTRHLVYFDTQDRPVMAGISHYRADQVRYSVRVPLRNGAAGTDQILDSLEFRNPASATKGAEQGALKSASKGAP